MRNATLYVFAAALSLLGCSSSVTRGDAAADAGPTPCTISLAATGCAASYEEELVGERMTTFCPGSFPRAGMCGGYVVVMVGPGVFKECIYDEASHALVSGFLESDVNSYCNGTSFDASAGLAIDFQNLCDSTALPALCAVDAGMPDGQ